jgi:hypothetical protein
MPIMRKRIQMILFPAALTLTLASCGRQIFMPAETPDTGAPVSTAADKDSLYVDPYLAGLTQGRLAWFMEQALGAVPVDTLPLSLHLSGANSQTVTPYAGYPAFTITVTAAPGSPLNGPVFLEVPHWQGDLQDHPRFRFHQCFQHERRQPEVARAGHHHDIHLLAVDVVWVHRMQVPFTAAGNAAAVPGVRVCPRCRRCAAGGQPGGDDPIRDEPAPAVPRRDHRLRGGRGRLIFVPSQPPSSRW